MTNQDLLKMANSYECNYNNNNIFNGKNLSDNSKVSNFYALKSHTPYQSPLLYFGQNDPTKVGQRTVQPVTEANMVKTMFVGDIEAGKCVGYDQPAPPTKVSNLLQKPALNSKYDDAWFLQNNPQYWNNIRSLGLLSDMTKPEDDPVMAINPALFKEVKARREEANFTDPF